MSDEWPDDWPVAAVAKIEEVEEERDAYSRGMVEEERRANALALKLGEAENEVSVRNDEVTGLSGMLAEARQRIKDLETQLGELRHDIERHVAIASNEAAARVEAESRLDLLRKLVEEGEEQAAISYLQNPDALEMAMEAQSAPVVEKRDPNPRPYIAMPDDQERWNNGTRCDMLRGPCACGSWHD